MQYVTVVAAERLAIGVSDRRRIDGIFDGGGAETGIGHPGPSEIIRAISSNSREVGAPSFVRYASFQKICPDFSQCGRASFGQRALNFRRCTIECERFARLDSHAPHLIEDWVVVCVRRVQLGQFRELRNISTSPAL